MRKIHFPKYPKQGTMLYLNVRALCGTIGAARDNPADVNCVACWRKAGLSKEEARKKGG